MKRCVLYTGLLALAIGCGQSKQTFVEAKAIYDDEVQKLESLKRERDAEVAEARAIADQKDREGLEAVARGEPAPPIWDFEAELKKIDDKYRPLGEAQRERVDKAEAAKEAAKP